MSRRIETKVSRTATATCLSRAISFTEKNQYYRSYDNISQLLVPPIFKVKLIQTLFKKMFMPKGIYEYVISRTNYIDDVFQNIKNSVEQIFIFGAGFDSRAIRFNKSINKIPIFELDSPNTQNAKIKKFKEVGVSLPENLNFISIDFDKDSLEKTLEASGFKKKKISLFILEGVRGHQV